MASNFDISDPVARERADVIRWGGLLESENDGRIDAETKAADFEHTGEGGGLIIVLILVTLALLAYGVGVFT